MLPNRVPALYTIFEKKKKKNVYPRKKIIIKNR